MKKKPTPPKKQHDLRGEALARLGDDCAGLADRIVWFSDLAKLFKKAGKRESKLR